MLDYYEIELLEIWNQNAFLKLFTKTSSSRYSKASHPSITKHRGKHRAGSLWGMIEFYHILQLRTLLGLTD